VGAAAQEGGLVGLDGEQVVGLLAGHQELGGGGVGVQCVGGDHHVGKVQVGQQGLEGGHLATRAVDVALGEDGAGGVVHRGEQVDSAAVAVGAAQRLAVDRDRPSPLIMAVAVGKPRTHRGGQSLGVKPGQRPADRGFGRDRPSAGEGIAAGAERGTDRLGCVRGPFGDRGDRPRTGQDRGSGEHQDATSGCRRPARVLGSVMVAR
jgi:hypothetical protein